MSSPLRRWSLLAPCEGARCYPQTRCSFADYEKVRSGSPSVSFRNPSGIFFSMSLSRVTSLMPLCGFVTRCCKCQSPWRASLWFQWVLFDKNLMVHLELVRKSLEWWPVWNELFVWSSVVSFPQCGFDGVITLEMLMSRGILNRFRGLNKSDSDKIRTDDSFFTS